MLVPKTIENVVPESPPAYEDAGPAPVTWNSNEKATYPPIGDPVIHPTSPAAAHSSSPKPRESSSWFCLGGGAASQVKQTVAELVKEIVKHPETTAPIFVLDSCAEACRVRGVSFAALLQEPYVEGHTPTYWAIIKRPPQQPQHRDDALIMALVAHAAPLKPATVSDIRLACLQNSDPLLFQRLRCSPAFAPLSGAEEMLMGHPDRRDRIEVEELPGTDGAFNVRIRVPMFQRRMKVANGIQLEFIARSRLWSLDFFITKPYYDKRLHATPGTWAVGLSLLENSAPTWVDSQLEIADTSPSVDDAPPSPLPDPALESSGDNEDIQASAGPKNIVLRLKTKSQRLAAPQWEFLSASLEELMNNLQYSGGVYVNDDESLDAQLSVKLVKSK